MATVTQVELSRGYLEWIKASTSLSEAFWRELFPDALRTEHPEVTVPLQAVEELCRALSVDAEKLIEGELDFEALAAHSRGNLAVIPEAYRDAANSRIRTSAHLFDAIESRFGWKARNAILRRRQVTDSHVYDLDARINIRFLTDVCSDLERMGVGSEDLYRMGTHSVVRNFYSAVGDEFRKASDVSELYERCFVELIQKYFDQNFRYRLLSLVPGRATVEAIPVDAVCDALRTLTLGSALVCRNKAGGFASLPGYHLLPFGKVTESRCIHRGDAACRFEIDFAAAYVSEGKGPSKETRLTRFSDTGHYGPSLQEMLSGSEPSSA